MLVAFPYFEFELSSGEAVSLQDVAGWTVSAVCGRLWLTEEQGGRDMWLAPGDKFALTQSGRLVIEAWRRPGEETSCPIKVRMRPPVSTVSTGFRLPRLQGRGAAVWA